MPLRRTVACPGCGRELRRKTAGRCPECGAPVSRHVDRVRAREERIERLAALVGTALVVLVFTLTAGLGLVEGLLAYAGAGALVFILAKKTFR